MNDKSKEIESLTGLPKDVIEAVIEDFTSNSTWGISNQVVDVWYKRVENIQINSVSKIPLTDLNPGDIFSFLNPETTKVFPIYEFKRLEDFRGLVYKIN